VHQETLPGTTLDPRLPDGFRYLPGFLAPAEEERVRAAAAALDLQPFRMRGFVARRLVASFGRSYAYDARAVEPGPPFPPFLLALRGRAAALAGVAEGDLAMALVSRYPPGAGIGWHRDAPAFGLVIGISLGAPARLQLRRGGPGGERLEVAVAPGSAYVLARAARWAWQHHLPPVRAERYAITFRTLRAPDGA
jgi:alkylated DNA repair protein (DNA oxidative demethylase)